MSDEVLPADMCPIGPGAARAIEHARLVREGEDCGCDPGYHDDEVVGAKPKVFVDSRFDPTSLTVRQFLAIPYGERPTMMDAEALWNRIQELGVEKDLAIKALTEAVQVAGHDNLIGHYNFLTAVINPEQRKGLVEEQLRTNRHA